MVTKTMKSQKNVSTTVAMKGMKSSGSANPGVRLVHEQIAQRAKAIWLGKGCPCGQDEQNWREAEAQLKAELGLR